MARYTNGPNGAFAGKLGNVVGSSWKGIPYLRSVPRVNKKRKRGDAEKSNNSSFGYLSRWLSPLREYLRIGMANYPEPLTWLNVGCRLNRHLVLPNSTGFDMDHSGVQLSYGNLAGLLNPVMEWNGNELNVTWETLPTDYSDGKDQLILAIFEPVNKRVNGFFGGVLRSSGKCNFGHSVHDGATAYVYAFFTSTDRTRISATSYLGEITS